MGRMSEDVGLTEQTAGPAEPPFGTGPLPHALQRLNWCGFFFPWMWALRFARWRYLGAYWSLVVLGWFATAAVRDGVGPTLLAQTGWAVVQLAIVALSLWIGVNANHIAWAAIAARGKDVGIGNLTASREAASQKLYLAAGLLLGAWSVYSFVREPIDLGWARQLWLAVYAVALLVASYFYLAGAHSSVPQEPTRSQDT
jgi:hypothetical protein